MRVNITSPPAAHPGRPATHGRGERVAVGLGFGRIVASEMETPNVLVTLIQSGGAAVQSDDATKPQVGHRVHAHRRRQGRRPGPQPPSGPSTLAP